LAGRIGAALQNESGAILRDHPPAKLIDLLVLPCRDADIGVS
jgi:hypothetical protein